VALPIGVFALLSDLSLSPGDVGQMVERHGLESLWLGEHSHLPVGSVHPYTAGGVVPEVYRRMVDPLIALTDVAARTSDLRLGTSLTLVAEHNVFHLAKQVATLDMLSGGRVELGVGYGWNTPEVANHGIDPAQRRKILGEKLAAMRRLWTEETASFDGEHVRFSESWAWPKPVQPGGPPILFGVPARRGSFADIAAFGDGWMPIELETGSALAAHIDDLRTAFKEAGRPDEPSITLFAPEGAMGGKRDLATFEARLPSADRLRELEALGAQRIILGVPTSDCDLLCGALRAIVRRRDEAGSGG
jgi:probable F420-dependent oxidoreductase